MAPTFCLRLACGLIASMLLLPTGQTPPRFFRVQYLIALGLLAVAGFFLGDGIHLWLGAALGFSLLVCVAGSIVWHVDGAPLSRAILSLAVVSVLGTMLLASGAQLLADDVTSAALLGSCTSAMLMGHSYLIAPAMSLTPLLRLLAAMGGALVLRVVVAGIALLVHEQSTTWALDQETILLLVLRWGLGFAGVLVLGWMAWESARIRSTQSATGILYVVVIFCFLGELSSQLLEMKVGGH
jgi:hypothetical protein